MGAIFRRELKAMLTSPRGYVAIAAYLAVFAVFFVLFHMYFGFAGIEAALSYYAIAMGVALPIVTVPLFCNNRGGRELLRSLPLSGRDLFFGKYLAGLTVVLVMTVVVAVMPPILGGFVGDGMKMNYLSSYAGVLVFFLLGHTLLCLNLWISSVLKKTLVAWVAVYLVLIALIVLSLTASLMPSFLSNVFECVSLFGVCGTFEAGLFDLRAVVLYVTASVLFFLLAFLSENDKWNREA